MVGQARPVGNGNNNALNASGELFGCGGGGSGNGTLGSKFGGSGGNGCVRVTWTQTWPPYGAVDAGTAQAGSATSITLAAGDSAVASIYVGMLIFLDSGTGVGQVGYCTAYNGSTKVATVNAWSLGVAPVSGSTYVIIAS